MSSRPFHVAVQLLWLGAEICVALARFALLADRRFSTRALWLHRSCRRVLRVLNMRLTSVGTLPESGLLACNHLSYLDIIALSSLAPAVFVAKREVQSWPLFGWLASLAGTLFVDRARRSDVRRANDKIRALLDNGVLVVVFPEATSTGGDTVLPFKSPLLEPALQQRHPITAGCIHYSMGDGNVRDEVCYWRDMTFLPHLLNVLCKSSIQASVSFEIVPHEFNRKQLARRLHSEVMRLKEGSHEKGNGQQSTPIQQAPACAATNPAASGKTLCDARDVCKQLASFADTTVCNPKSLLDLRLGLCFNRCVHASS